MTHSAKGLRTLFTIEVCQRNAYHVLLLQSEQSLFGTPAASGHFAVADAQMLGLLPPSLESPAW